MEIKNLLDVCEINDKSVDKFEGIKNYVATGDVDYDKIISFDEVNYDDKPSRANREVEIGDILVAKMKETVKVAKITEENYYKYIFSTGFSTLKAKEDKLNTDYLYYVLISDYFQIQKDKYSKGATQKAINNTGLKKIKIPVPPIKMQKQIVGILDEAQRLIDNRKEQIKLLDDLIESVFYDMFGDPVRNDKGWKVKKLKEESICIVPARDKPKSFTGSIPWITINDLERSGYTITSKEGLGLTEKEILEVNRKAVPVGCVLMSCVGNLGITSINGVELVINQQIHAFECNDNLNNKYLKHYIPKRIDYLDRVANSTTVKYINKTKCENIPLLLPPISLQNQFAEKVQVIESQKQLLEESQKLLEDNYNSLMQRAFKGQLF